MTVRYIEGSLCSLVRKVCIKLRQRNVQIELIDCFLIYGMHVYKAYIMAVLGMAKPKNEHPIIYGYFLESEILIFKQTNRDGETGTAI